MRQLQSKYRQSHSQLDLSSNSRANTQAIISHPEEDESSPRPRLSSDATRLSVSPDVPSVGADSAYYDCSSSVSSVRSSFTSPPTPCALTPSDMRQHHDDGHNDEGHRSGSDSERPLELVARKKVGKVGHIEEEVGGNVFLPYKGKFPYCFHIIPIKPIL